MAICPAARPDHRAVAAARQAHLSLAKAAQQLLIQRRRSPAAWEPTFVPEPRTPEAAAVQRFPARQQRPAAGRSSAAGRPAAWAGRRRAHQQRTEVPAAQRGLTTAPIAARLRHLAVAAGPLRAVAWVGHRPHSARRSAAGVDRPEPARSSGAGRIAAWAGLHLVRRRQVENSAAQAILRWDRPGTGVAREGGRLGPGREPVAAASMAGGLPRVGWRQSRYPGAAAGRRGVGAGCRSSGLTRCGGLAGHALRWKGFRDAPSRRALGSSGVRRRTRRQSRVPTGPGPVGRAGWEGCYCGGRGGGVPGSGGGVAKRGWRAGTEPAGCQPGMPSVQTLVSRVS